MVEARNAYFWRDTDDYRRIIEYFGNNARADIQGWVDKDQWRLEEAWTVGYGFNPDVVSFRALLGKGLKFADRLDRLCESTFRFVGLRLYPSCFVRYFHEQLPADIRGDLRRALSMKFLRGDLPDRADLRIAGTEQATDYLREHYYVLGGLLAPYEKLSDAQMAAVLSRYLSGFGLEHTPTSLVSHIERVRDDSDLDVVFLGADEWLALDALIFCLAVGIFGFRAYDQANVDVIAEAVLASGRFVNENAIGWHIMDARNNWVTENHGIG